MTFIDVEDAQELRDAVATAERAEAGAPARAGGALIRVGKTGSGCLMGYDIWLEADVGGDERRQLDFGDVPGNITYNVDPMFALALDGDAELGIQNGAQLLMERKAPALKRFVGGPAADAIAPLRRAIQRMEADPGPYKDLNPANGWGDYAGALDYLKRFAAACEAAPAAYVGGWL